MLIGITHTVSPKIRDCEITFIERQPIDYELALRQHDEYCAPLSRCGVEIKRLSINLDYPDSCFVEDTAIVVDELAVITSPGAESRRGETAAIKSELAKYKETVSISLPATIDGGDVLRVEKELFVGLSNRTNAQGIEELARILKPFDYRVYPVKLTDCLHLKSAVTALNDETLIINPHWIDLEPFKKFRLLYTPEDEPWAANSLCVGNRIFLQAGFPRMAEIVQKLHEDIEILNISEFQKAEAALTCLSIIF